MDRISRSRISFGNGSGYDVSLLKLFARQKSVDAAEDLEDLCQITPNVESIDLVLLECH